MAWKLQEIVDIEQHKKDCPHGEWYKKKYMPIGSWWYEKDWFDELKNKPTSGHADFIRKYCVSEIYLKEVFPSRAPFSMCLPNGSHWSPDAKSSNGNGWKVTGSPANWTAMPSIFDNQGRKQTPDYLEYHGWLKDGVLTDDLSKIQYGHLNNEWKEK